LVTTIIKGSEVINGPRSLAVESSASTPPEKRHLFKKKKNKNRISLASMKERTEHSQNVVRPESKDEFLSLDFVQRCAIAGLQLGKTKVFLRREAFDRIEAMRSQKFFGSACKIQAMVRGKLYREHYKRMRSAIVIIQSLMRLKLSQNHLGRKRNEMIERSIAAKQIQRFYRSFKFRQQNDDFQYMLSGAATVIQARARGIIERNRYYTGFFGFIQLQAVVRGFLCRKALEEEQKVRAVVSPVQKKPESQEKIQPHDFAQFDLQEKEVTPVQSTEIQTHSSDLFRYMQEEDWASVEKTLDSNPILAEEIEPSSGELPLHVISRHTSAWTLLVDMVLVLNPKALVHTDKMGALPIHHAAAHDNIAALEIIYNAYKGGINEVDKMGRLPLHVAAEFDAVDAVKFLLTHAPEAAFTMVYRPVDGTGGGLPLHVACNNHASIGVITALLAENFASAKRADENGDLPLHLLLRCGENVDQVVVKTLLTCFSAAASRTDMNGDLPLSIAIKNRCRPTVINSILMQYPNAAASLNSEGQSPLHLAFEYGADDRTILGLLNHAPEYATVVDKKTGLLPIQVATQNEHSHFIVHNMLKRDMPIELDEKIRAQLLPHHYSWNHVVSYTDDMYHQVVTKVLQQCTQPQVLALAHVEGPDGKIALASATTVCKHEMRVMLRLFNTLEVVNQKPAYTNPISDTQIFYALRYEPPAMQNSTFTILHEEKTDKALGDYVEDWDDTSVTSAVSRASIRSNLSTRSQQSIDDKLRQIRKEKGQQVIAKLTSRSEIVERELKVRKDYRLSRHYVPAVISVHHTVQHAAYSEAMAEPGYCITMEGADTTAENLMLDMRKAGKPFPIKALKRLGISLLHMHEHGLVHCDFGTHNIGKFGSRWKLLGVGGSVPIGKATNPNRGFYHPPESIVVENKRAAIGKKSVNAVVVSIPTRATYDIWAYGVVFYEAIAGVPLSPYACRGKRPMTSVEVAKIGQWDENNIRRAIKHLPPDADEDAISLMKKLLHWDPSKRFNSMRQALEHPFFVKNSSSSQASSFMNSSGKASGSGNGASGRDSASRTGRQGPPQSTPSRSSKSKGSMSSPSRSYTNHASSSSRVSTGQLAFVDENSENIKYLPDKRGSVGKKGGKGSKGNSNSNSNNMHFPSSSSVTSATSKKSKKFGSSFRNRFKNRHSSSVH
jgi:ankyrin repeat protein